MEVANISVYNLDGAIRGMRAPMRSWDKSDSRFDGSEFEIGENDLELMRRLIRGGTEHRKFLRQIFVSCDITAPEYFWKEYATYKVGTCENSTSTMHTIHKRDLTRDDFELSGYDGDFELLDASISKINSLRAQYLSMENDAERKRIWKRMIVHIPPTYLYTRTCSLNYEILLNMHRQRRNHKLIEWHIFLQRMSEDCPYLADFVRMAI